MRNIYTYTLNLLLVLAPMSLLAQLPWAASSPGPDSYGYTWKTNSDPAGPAYIWEDISVVGTEVTGLGDDGNFGPVQMGIDFPYYWYTRNEVWIADNGFIAFSNTPIGSGANGFPPTPTSDEPNDVIAPYMADMNPTGAGNPHNVYYYSDTANNRFIVSWENMPYWVPPTTNPNQWAGSNSFQVILDANDSSVTFNYKQILGNWATPYDDDPYPFVVGIENVSGTFGLLAPSLPTNNPALQKPVDNSAIRFYAPKTASPVTDVAVSNVQNDEIQAFFVPWAAPATNPPPPTFKLFAGVTNVGNTDINAPIPIIGQVKDNNQLLFYQARDTAINGLQAGETQYFQFPIPLYPPTPGALTYEVSTENPAIYGDQNASNDSRINEAVVIDTTLDEVTFSYASGNFDNLINTNGGGLISWSGNNGNSGAAAFYDSYGYPVTITALEMFVGTGAQDTTSEGFLAQIYALDSTGAVPGALLYSDTVLTGEVPQFPVGPTTPWTRIDLDSSITIESDGFYVAWIQRSDSTNLFTESAPNALPISRRSYEILGGNWSIWRSNSTDEMWIRALVNIEETVIDTTNTSIREPLSDLTTLNVYPNPSDGMFVIQTEWAVAQPVELKVFDINGRKVYRDRVEAAATWERELDLRHLDRGLYLLQVSSLEGSTMRRLVIR